MKVYEPKLPQATKNLRKNPLLKSKGRIKEDWTGREGYNVVKSALYECHNMPFSGLIK